MLLACALALVISVTAALTACSSENKETTAESNSSAEQVVGVWEAYDIYDSKQGTMTEAGYAKISEQFQAIYAFNFAEDGTGSFIRFGVRKPFTWTVDGDGKITVTLEGTAGTFTGQIDASTGRLRLKGPDETDAELKQVSKTPGPLVGPQGRSVLRYSLGSMPTSRLNNSEKRLVHV
ncbi:lipocalin family protein [Olsenella uli]|mgnify:FL=1|uniref:lipocalin family protein n=1 Tax=Olsenella uli TaxID=133926 RepID=UPI0039909541